MAGFTPSLYKNNLRAKEVFLLLFCVSTPVVYHILSFMQLILIFLLYKLNPIWCNRSFLSFFYNLKRLGGGLSIFFLKIQIRAS